MDTIVVYCRKCNNDVIISPGMLWTGICDTCRFGTYAATQKERPPIGLYPRFLHDEKRLDDVTQAIQRYMNAHETVPAEWWDECNELVEREQKRKERIE